MDKRRCDVVIIAAAKLQSMKWKLTFFVSSYSAGGVQEIYDGEDLHQYTSWKRRILCQVNYNKLIVCLILY